MDRKILLRRPARKKVLIVVGTLLLIAPFSTILPLILSKILWKDPFIAKTLFSRDIALGIKLIEFMSNYTRDS